MVHPNGGPDEEHEPVHANVAALTGSCGAERWSVKTGTDADASTINLQSTTPTTIASLDALPAPSSLPSNWLHIDTAETGTTAYDTLTVKVGGTTLASYSNTNAASGYARHTVSLTAYIGQTIAVTFTGSEDYTQQTSFVLDDTALTVT
jgi:hypothetical protein